MNFNGFFKFCLMIVVALTFCSCGEKDEIIQFSSTQQPAASENIKTDQLQDVSGSKSEDESQDDFEEKTKIFVHVCGAVVIPGVYEVSQDARVIDAVTMAGGCREDASSDSLNLAGKLTDGQQIYIPTKEEVANSSIRWNQTAQNDEVNSAKEPMININTAGKEELMTLPGIGEAKAESILLYRQENGSFQKIEDIQQISGIKEAAFEKIKDRITV